MLDVRVGGQSVEGSQDPRALVISLNAQCKQATVSDAETSQGWEVVLMGEPSE